MLYLYHTTNINNPIDSQNPFTVTFDGRRGGSQDRMVFVRNDDITKYYTNIIISVVDTEGDSIVDGTAEGWSWKLMIKETAPTNEEWALVSPGNTISLSNIGSSAKGDISTFLSFWVRVTIPNHEPVQTIKDVVFRISGSENAVGA